MSAPSFPSPPGDKFAAAHALDEPRALLLVQVEGSVGHPAYQVVASVRLKVPWASHGEQFTKYSVTPPLLLHQWGLTLGLREQARNTSQPPAHGEGAAARALRHRPRLHTKTRASSAASDVLYNDSIVFPRHNRVKFSL